MRRIIVLIFLCIFVSHAILAEPEHSSKDENRMSLNNIDHWMAPEDAAETENPIAGEPASVERGKALFNMHCSSCHGEDGRGDGSIGTSLNPKPSDLVKSSGMHSDGDIAWKIANGRGRMPAWKDILNQTEIWDIVNYIKYISKNNFSSNKS